MLDKFKGVMFGGAIGDAVGTTAEFVPRHVVEENPVTDMVGQGKFCLEPGMFTDDTSMMLCLAESLLLCGAFSGVDQQKRYHSWYMDGHMSSNGLCFDIGKTTVKHLLENIESGSEFHPHMSDGASGNGALMRLSAVPLFYCSNPELAIECSGKSSLTTHPSEISRDACRYYAALILGALHGVSKEELLSSGKLFVPQGVDEDYWSKKPLRQEVLDIVQKCSYKSRNPPDINNSAYVISSMESALWSFHHTNDYKEGLLKVVNLGDDADTVGCIYGMLAGAFYGLEGIPQEWVGKLALSDLFHTFSEELYKVYQDNKEKAHNEITVELSSHFTHFHTRFIFLENRYASIKRRVEPCPAMYKSVQQFDQDVDALRVDYQSEDNLFKEFSKRLAMDRAVVLKRTEATSARSNLFAALRKN